MLKKNGLTVPNISSFYNNFFFQFLWVTLVTLLISSSYCKYVPSTAITDIPFCYADTWLRLTEIPIRIKLGIFHLNKTSLYSTDLYFPDDGLT
jgi:hypothetical protein